MDLALSRITRSSPVEPEGLRVLTHFPKEAVVDPRPFQDLGIYLPAHLFGCQNHVSERVAHQLPDHPYY